MNTNCVSKILAVIAVVAAAGIGLIAVRGIWRSGEGEAADDAAATAWASRADILAGLYPTFPTLLPLFDLALGKT